MMLWSLLSRFCSRLPRVITYKESEREDASKVLAPGGGCGKMREARLWVYAFNEAYNINDPDRSILSLRFNDVLGPQGARWIPCSAHSASKSSNVP